MSVLFQEGNKRLELSIIGYEFPLKKGMDSFDANWLMVKIDCTEGEECNSHKDSCLLADELENVIKDITEIIDGKQTGMMTMFIEPYLRFSLTKTNVDYTMQVRFVYDTLKGWKEFYIVQKLSVKELSDKRDALRRLSDQFPVRKVNNR